MFVVVLALALIASIVLSIWHRSGEYFFLLFVGFFASLATVLVVDLPVNWIMRDKADFSYDLAVLNDGQSTHGSFFLGSGTIDSEPSFMYYEKDGGSYTLQSWPAYSANVVETSDNPHVVYHCDDYTGVPRPFRWAPEFMEDGSPYDCRHASVTFYVPAGSVKQQYTLDAQ